MSDSLSEHEHDRKALALALMLVVTWGVNFTVQKYAMSKLSPSGFLFARYLIMPACALVLMRLQLGKWLPPISRSDLRKLMWLGIFGNFLNVGFSAYGMYLSTPFSSAITMACGPLFTLLILRWKKLERLIPIQLVGVCVACVGVVTFLSEKLVGGQLRTGLGDLFLLGGAALFSYYTVAAKPMIERLGLVATLGYVTLLGSVPMVACTAVAATSVTWSSLDAWAWSSLLWSVVVSAFGGWLAWGWINAVRGVARTAPLMYLTPPVAGLCSWFITGEHYTTVKIVGASVTLVGVAIAQYAKQLVQAAKKIR